MTLLNNIANTSAAALLLISAPASHSGPARHLLLQCDDAEHAQMCDALIQALTSEFTGYTVDASDDAQAQIALTLTYEEHNRADSWLSGQLSWRSAKGQDGHSPIIEYSVMDRQLVAEDLNTFARQLIRSANIRSQF